MKRLILILLSILFCFPSIPIDAQDYSDWAIDGIQYLKEIKKIDNQYFKDYHNSLTRGEFTYLTVVLYEILTGSDVSNRNYNKNTFKDTKDSTVLIAYELNLVEGHEDGTFRPNEFVTREQIAALFMRCLKESGISYNTNISQELKFTDWDISDWALQSVKEAYHIGVINGVAYLTIAPQQNVEREQAYVMIYNILSNLNRIKNNYTRGKTILTPTLKYAYAGAYKEGWTEEAYNSSPAVYDLNHDGNMEIVSAAYSIVNIDGKTGNLNSRINSGHEVSETNSTYVGRTWADVIVKDIDLDGFAEIITGHNKGVVSVYSWDGYFKAGWPKKLSDAEVKSVKVEDLDNDGTCEIIVGLGVEDGANVYVLEHDGSVRQGWPQLSAAADATKDKSLSHMGYAWGVFNDSISVGDINNDGYKEIIVPSDVPFICAYDSFGNLLPANSKYGGRSWGNIGVWEDSTFEDKVENEGWGLGVNIYTGLPVDLTKLSRSERYTANFTFGKSIISDLDSNGTNEVIVTGNVYDRAYGFPPPGKYQGLFIFNGDRTRFKTSKYDWSSIPVDTGAPLSEDWNVIELCMPDPVAEDLDMDGIKEILYPTYNGVIQCFWLTKEHKYNWPISVYDGKTIEFASSPAVKDLNGDGYKEVILTTFTQKDSAKKGKLMILNYKGEVLQTVELPDSLGNNIPNGGIASPTVCDVDSDGIDEIVLNTFYSAVTVYDIHLQ